MAKLDLSLEEARVAYSSHDAGKAMLEKMYPKKQLIGNVLERCTTFEGVLEEVGETQQQFDHRTQFDDEQEKASKRISLITKALNEGEKNPRWYIWFNDHAHGSGVGLSLGGVGCRNDGVVVGSRHRFSNETVAIHAVKYFLPDFEVAYQK